MPGADAEETQVASGKVAQGAETAESSKILGELPGADAEAIETEDEEHPAHEEVSFDSTAACLHLSLRSFVTSRDSASRVGLTFAAPCSRAKPARTRLPHAYTDPGTGAPRGGGRTRRRRRRRDRVYRPSSLLWSCYDADDGHG
jgi:hypothetical protein